MQGREAAQSCIAHLTLALEHLEQFVKLCGAYPVLENTVRRELGLGSPPLAAALFLVQCRVRLMLAALEAVCKESS